MLATAGRGVARRRRKAAVLGLRGGGQKPDAGAGGAGGGPAAACRPTRLRSICSSDFEEGRAIVLPLGSPARNGAWFAYNDGTCLQSPAHGDGHHPKARRPRWRPGSAGAARCTSTGTSATAGARARARTSLPPVTDGGASPPAADALRPDAVRGLAFWAMATPGTETNVRLKMVMRASTQQIDGGACDESILGVGLMRRRVGLAFSLPADGTWKPVSGGFSESRVQARGLGEYVRLDSRRRSRDPVPVDQRPTRSVGPLRLLDPRHLPRPLAGQGPSPRPSPASGRGRRRSGPLSPWERVRVRGPRL